jgi:hypothetical protein
VSLLRGEVCVLGREPLSDGLPADECLASDAIGIEALVVEGTGAKAFVCRDRARGWFDDKRIGRGSALRVEPGPEGRLVERRTEGAGHVSRIVGHVGEEVVGETVGGGCV